MKRRQPQKKVQSTNKKLSLSIPNGAKFIQVIGITDAGEIYQIPVGQ